MMCAGINCYGKTLHDVCRYKLLWEILHDVCRYKLLWEILHDVCRYKLLWEILHDVCRYKLLWEILQNVCRYKLLWEILHVVCRYLPDGGTGHQLSVGAVVGVGAEYPSPARPASPGAGLAALRRLPGGGQTGVCSNLHLPLPLLCQHLLLFVRLLAGQAPSAERRQA